MEKEKKYLKPDADIIWFSKDNIYTDVISTSDVGGDDDENIIGG